MDSVATLIPWVIAADGPSPVVEGSVQSEMQDALLLHYTELGMNETSLQQIVGPGSMLAMIIANVKTTIYRDP
jgi:hypothetical protein